MHHGVESVLQNLRRHEFGRSTGIAGNPLLGVACSRQVVIDDLALQPGQGAHTLTTVLPGCSRWPYFPSGHWASMMLDGLMSRCAMQFW